MKQSKIKDKALFQIHGTDFPFSSATRTPSDSESDAGSTSMEVDMESATDGADSFFPHAVSNAAENQGRLKRHYHVRHLIASQSVKIT